MRTSTVQIVAHEHTRHHRGQPDHRPARQRVIAAVADVSRARDSGGAGPASNSHRSWPLAALLGFTSMACRSSSTKPCRARSRSPARRRRPVDQPDRGIHRPPAPLVERAAQAGAADVEPITEHDAPSGLHRQGGFTDPFGDRWSEGYHTPNGFPSENRRRATGITLNVGPPRAGPAGA
jgi:hypothetical protein